MSKNFEIEQFPKIKLLNDIILIPTYLMFIFFLILILLSPFILLIQIIDFLGGISEPIVDLGFLEPVLVIWFSLSIIGLVLGVIIEEIAKFYWKYILKQVIQKHL